MKTEKLIGVINDTIDKCENEYKWMIDNAKNIYYNERYFSGDISVLLVGYTDSKIKLIQKTTVQAIIENKGKVYAVLNFASAKHPGGGVLRGTVAQEEALSRASSLYPVIKQCEDFYTLPVYAPYYTDKIIYSKPIYVIKNDYGEDVKPIECEVITCAAPNYSNSLFNEETHRWIMTVRFTKVLKSAIANNQRNLILGAWGCGVFQNPADINAQIFREVLEDFHNSFDEVIFAIPDDTNFKIFKKNLF